MLIIDANATQDKASIKIKILNTFVHELAIPLFNELFHHFLIVSRVFINQIRNDGLLVS